MLTLNTIQRQPGATRKNKRLGRGAGSGHGGTSTKGHKGQKARKSGQVRAGFEGGQTPLYRRTPKRGFTNIFRVGKAELNLSDLEKLDPKTYNPLTLEALQENGVVKGQVDRLVILGTGQISKAFDIKAHKISKAALEKIQKVGGKFEQVVFGKLVKKSNKNKKK
jgi:large subunit ribosomal protein L15